MKVLDVKESDCDGYWDWLVGQAAKDFVSGGYTHVRDWEGNLITCQYVGDYEDGTPMVMVGEDAIENFNVTLEAVMEDKG